MVSLKVRVVARGARVYPRARVRYEVREVDEITIRIHHVDRRFRWVSDPIIRERSLGSSIKNTLYSVEILFP